MINMMIGQPGGGKSYEAVAFHVLPALEQGRKVITNLPLDVEAFRRIDARFPDLIILRHSVVEKETEKKQWNVRWRSFDVFNVKQTHRPFASLADYGDEWRHPVKGCGPLYVIDECHLCLPRARPGTAQEVEEWFSLHRHEVADVLLITQSYGKVCKAICDMVQVLYRVKKATAFGTNNRYIRKVQDGIGGEVVNTGMREYEKKYFSLYKSHTKSSEAGQELAANDIVPFWKRWPVIGAGACFLVVVLMLIFGGSPNPMKAAQAKTVEISDKRKKDVASGVISPASAVASAPTAAGVPVVVSGVLAIEAPEVSRPISQVSGKVAVHPFSGLTFHIAAFIQSETKWRYSFIAEQNGQQVGTITQTHLEESGYTVEKLSECSARITFKEYSFYAVCDLPRIQAIRTS